MRTVAKLPQQDTNTVRRSKYLAKMRKEYAYQYSYDHTFATVITLPESQKPDCRYNCASLRNLAPLIPKFLARLPGLLWNQMKAWIGIPNPITRYQDYLFFGRSSYLDSDTRFLDNFLSDEYFGLQRVIGVNHVTLQGVTEQNSLPNNLALDRIKTLFTEIVPDTSFDEAQQTGRLYYVDYAMLQGLADHPGEYNGRKQYVTAPIVLLYRESNGLLRPIAIQLRQTPATDNPVFTPLDAAWTAAKLYAQVADINYQEYVTHATRIHYLVESFIIATYRELYKTHPVFLLLQPNFRYTLSVNAHHLFLKNDKGQPGYFGKALSGDYDSMIALMSEAFKTYDFTESALPTDIQQRQVDTPELYYPYTTTGKTLWDITQQFALDYLQLYYPNNETLLADNEIQSWARVMASDNGMRIKGFPDRFTTVEGLAQAVGHILFITTAKHSSIHYPQYLFAGYIPAMPFAAYTPPPTEVDTVYTQQDLLAALPLRKPAFAQAFTFYLTNFRVGRMGSEHQDLDAKAQPVMAQYQQRLAELAATLTDAEMTSPYPYIYLNPTYIPGSVMV